MVLQAGLGVGVGVLVGEGVGVLEIAGVGVLVAVGVGVRVGVAEGIPVGGLGVGVGVGEAAGLRVRIKAKMAGRLAKVAEIQTKYNAVSWIIHDVQGTIDWAASKKAFLQRLKDEGVELVENSSLIAEKIKTDAYKNGKLNAVFQRSTKTLHLSGTLDDASIETLTHELIHIDQLNLGLERSLFLDEFEAVVGSIYLPPDLSELQNLDVNWDSKTRMLNNIMNAYRKLPN